MWRFAIPLVTLLILVTFFWRGLYLNPGEVPSPLIGKPAPEFTLPTVRNPDVTFSHLNLREQPSIVNIWGTWCVGCRQEHDTLLTLASLTETPIYGINYKDDRDSAIEWLEKLGDPYAMSGFDVEGTVSIDWGVYGAPETFVLDKDGIIRFKHIGPLTPEIVQEDILPLLASLQTGD
ncbi:MAG: DsbE family thiol:disulfide interchange protein [Gammaproteobacteria bacterium]|nr:DsbE family thiol:disulfide interchange protein [Gammaproteobacteria bacterium]